MVDKFNAAFPSIVEDILQNSELDVHSVASKMGKNRLRELLEYTVPPISSGRGYIVPLAFQQFVRDPSEIQLQQAYVVGWCFQMIQSVYALADDIMDGAKFRWGKPGWHCLSELNNKIGVNDCFLLEHAAYGLLRKHFEADPVLHYDLMNIINDTTYKTILGQQLDALIEIDDMVTEDFVRLDSAAALRAYKKIVEKKSGYSFLYLPVLLGLRLAGLSQKDNSNLYNEVGNVALQVGAQAQLLDDFLDWTGPNANAETFADIRRGKPNWFYQQARRLSLNCLEDEKTLRENYGQAEDHCVAAVVTLYNKLNLRDHYKELEQEFCVEIETSAKAIEEEYSVSGIAGFFSYVTNKMLDLMKPGNDEHVLL